MNYHREITMGVKNQELKEMSGKLNLNFTHGVSYIYATMLESQKDAFL